MNASIRACTKKEIIGNKTSLTQSCTGGKPVQTRRFSCRGQLPRETEYPEVNDKKRSDVTDLPHRQPSKKMQHMHQHTHKNYSHSFSLPKILPYLPERQILPVPFADNGKIFGSSTPQKQFGITACIMGNRK
jgi:hypothetical protein